MYNLNLDIELHEIPPKISSILTAERPVEKYALCRCFSSSEILDIRPVKSKAEMRTIRKMEIIVEIRSFYQAFAGNESPGENPCFR